MKLKDLLIAGIAIGLVVVIATQRAGCGGLGVGEGEPAPQFRAVDVAGGPEWTLERFAGRPFVLVFFATWCPACREEMPSVARISATRPTPDVLVVSDESVVQVQRYLAAAHLAVPAAAAGHGVWGAFGVRALPSAVLVGADGRVAYAGAGPAAVGRALRGLVSEQP